mmetsp:Transcript_34778/g.25930  ORF Transcript_34778/g.25930 Transcript_34778/m.25930 type:complete len:163 (+) Transcript_34778:730-1218(+)
MKASLETPEFATHLNQNESLFFKVSGHIERVICDEQRLMYYSACVGCHKKTMPEGDVFRCESCGKRDPRCDIKYNLTVKVADLSGSFFLQAMGAVGEDILGVPAEDFKQFRESHPYEEVKDYLNQCCQFKNFVFVVAVKQDNYLNAGSEELRKRYQTIKVYP